MVDREHFDALCRQKLNVYTARSIREVEPSIDYRHNWHIDCVAEHLQAVWDRDIKRLIINIPPRSLKTHTASVAFPTWGFIQDPSIKFMLTSFKFELAKKMTRRSRMVMQSDWYRNLAPHVEISGDQNEKHYFETTGKGHYYSAAMSSVTGEGADIVICDDPLNPDEAASSVQRQNCIDTIRGTLFSRFNDEENGRFILIMQRLNADDPTGELLKDDGWTHLKLPAEAINKSYSYSINGKSWELKEGDLLFPERLSREVLDKKLKEMGSYNYCTPYETPITMSDLSDKPIGEIKVGDEILGFEAGDYRQELKPAKVLNINKRKAEVFEYTLCSGEIVRCTDNHKWYTARSGKGSHKKYLPPKIGRQLMRVVNPLMNLKTEEDFRMAGWLAGFYDGDGSATIQRNKNNRCHITFTQGTGRNITLCKKLEEALNYFGITFSYRDHVRSDNKSTNHKIRMYTISGRGLDNYRKFLHVIKVSKWREKMVRGSHITRFIIGREKIISSRSLGIQDVYGLTTETGNYIAWGMASSNSGQMLQEPAPIGGGMFKTDWINWYASKPFDAKQCNIYILVDPSTGDDDAIKNDLDYTGMAVWALAPDQNYYLIDGIKDRLNPTDRVNKLFELHRKWNGRTGKPPKVGYETIGFKSDKHFIERKMQLENYRFALKELPPKGERRLSKTKKVERLVPLFESGQVWLPNDLFYLDENNLQRNLISDMIEQEYLLFPFAPHDDFMDAMSMIFDVDPVFPRIGSVNTSSGLDWGREEVSVFDI